MAPEGQTWYHVAVGTSVWLAERTMSWEELHALSFQGMSQLRTRGSGEGSFPGAGYLSAWVSCSLRLALKQPVIAGPALSGMQTLCEGVSTLATLLMGWKTGCSSLYTVLKTASSSPPPCCSRL